MVSYTHLQFKKAQAWPREVYTDEQCRSIEHTGGHSLTYAVAGSGKTQMLVGRVRFLLEQGIPDNRIRVLAFNRAAAKEFELRLKDALPAGVTAPKVSTFHSLGLSLTRLFENAGLLPRRRLEDKEGVEKKLAREAALQALKEQRNDAYPSQDELEALRAFIGLVKSDILSAKDAFKAFGIPADLGYFIRAYALFEQTRERQGLRFFADLLAEPVALMRADPRALAMVTNKLDLVLVDEFQDVSRVQLELLVQLIGSRASLNAVGDDSQCIYAWRGSRPGFMGSDFDTFFPDATRYTLSRTFRFGHRLSLAAAQLIANNKDRTDALCVSAPGTPDTDIGVIRASSTGEQSETVAAIEAWFAKGRGYRDCAVLARLWAQVIGLELALLEREIPYYKPKDDVFKVPEVAGLLGYLRLAAGTLFDEPRAPEIVRHMLTTPTLWLPAPTLDALCQAILREPAQGARRIYDVAAQVRKPYMAKRIRERADIWHDTARWGDLPAAEVLRMYAARTDMLDLFAKAAASDAASEKQIAYDALLGIAARTGAPVRGFIERMDQLRNARERYHAGGDAVLLSSIHQAKGLEWPLVIVAGLEQGQFPSERADPQEERRLAYVAFTRAKEELQLVIPPDERFDRAWRGEPEHKRRGSKAVASQFVFEANLRTSIDVGDSIHRRLSGAEPHAPLPSAPPRSRALLNRYLEEVGIAERYEPPEPAPPNDESTSKQPWSLHDRVRHRVFGDGYVVGFAGRDILDIDFGGQRRRIKTSVAPLERLS